MITTIIDRQLHRIDICITSFFVPKVSLESGVRSFFWKRIAGSFTRRYFHQSTRPSNPNSSCSRISSITWWKMKRGSRKPTKSNLQVLDQLLRMGSHSKSYCLFYWKTNIYIIRKSFCAFTNKFSQLLTTGVREHQSNVTCFYLIRSHQTCILVEYMGEGWPSTHDPTLNVWTRWKSHQLGQQIDCK